MLNPSIQEGFYDRFGKQIADTGYDRAERLFPVHLAYPIHTPIYRYKSGKQQSTGTLYQLGAGIFSAHALPPYRNWVHFRPIVETGLMTLFKTRNEGELVNLTGIVLRYINQFPEQVIGGRTISHFIRQVFQIDIQIPSVLREQISDEKAIVPNLALKAPLVAGLELTLVVGPGQYGATPGVVLDISVSSVTPVLGDLKPVLDILESAHSIIRKLFLGMTLPVHDQMHPVERGSPQ
jgi:uncharacterized protein (TIGR04255 family)